MNEIDPREAALPKWAMEKLHYLRTALAQSSEQQRKEIAALRPKVEKLERKNAALEELLTCAAKGGHKTAQEIIAVIESYALTLTPNE